MKPFTQLLRQPIRTVIALILLTASAAFMCLGWGVFRSAEATANEIDESFATLVLLGPTYVFGKSVGVTLDPETGMYVSTEGEEEVILGTWDPEITKAEYYDALETSPLLRGIYRQQVMSASVPGLCTVTSATSGTEYSSRIDEPYDRAVLVIKLTDLNTEYTSYTNTDLYGKEHTVYGYDVYIEGEVVDRPAIHPDFEPRSRFHLATSTDSQEEFNALLSSFEIGGTYIVNVNNYSDKDLLLRQQIISTDKFLFGDRGFTADMLDTGTLRYDEELDHYVIDDPDGDVFILDEEELDEIDTCSCSISALREVDGEKVDAPTFARVENSVEDFLADPKNAAWAELVENLKAQYGTVPVIGTDLLKSLYVFHENIAYVTEGRDFETSDYTEGRRVCLISESLAQANGLKVGDKLKLGLYNGGVVNDHETANPAIRAQRYDGASAIQDTREYEIVGIYANTQEWSGTGLKYNWDTGEVESAETGGFNTNTVFVPNASLTGLGTYTDEYSLQSIVLKNGKEDEFKKFLAEKGWPEDLFVYFDGGYSEIKDTMEGFMDSPVQLLLVAAATFLVIMAAYIALFVTRQRRDAGLMLSLGAGKRRAAGVVFVTSLIPAAIASVTGAALGALYLNRAVDSVFGEAVTGGEFAKLVRVEPESAILACLMMFLIYILLLGAASILMCRCRPLKLLKK